MMIKRLFAIILIFLNITGVCLADSASYYPPHEAVDGGRAAQNMPLPLTIDTVKRKELLGENNFDNGQDSSDILEYSYTTTNDAKFEDGAIKIVKTEETKATGAQVTFKYSGQVIPREYYAFTCRIKCEGLVNSGGGPRNLLEAYGMENGTNKWLAHSHIYDGHRYESGDAEYTICQMLQVPENTDCLNLSAYVNANTVGTIYFDDFKLYRISIDPMESILLSPSYKGLIFEEGYADINLDVKLEESSFYSFDDNMTLEVKLVDINDKVLRFATEENLSERMNFVFSSIGLDTGEYYLQTILKDETGEVISKKEHTIRRTNELPETYLNENGNLVRNGEKKFFKKIMSHSGTTEGTTYMDVAEDAISAGLDSVSHYGMWWLQESANTEAIDYMRQNNLKMHLTLGGYWWGNYGERANMFETFVEKQEDIIPFFTKIANNYKDDDVLEGYYIFDEPHPVFEGEEIRWNNEILAQLDINHPTFGIADKDYDRYGIYTKMTDILGVDPYPVYGKETDDIARVGQVVREAKTNFPNRPVYLVLQCFNWGNEQNDDTMRGPNLTELKNMAWQGICEGAVGLDAFSYPSMKNDAAKSFDEWWSDLTTVYSEVEEYGDVIISEEPSPLYTVSGGGEWLNILVKRYEGNTYIFAVNNTNEEKSASVNIKGIDSQVLNFKPLGVEILKLSQPDFKSPEAELMALGFSNGKETFAVSEGEENILYVPCFSEVINYSAKISDGAKLYIGSKERETQGKITLKKADSFTVRVVAEDGVTETYKTYKIVRK